MKKYLIGIKNGTTMCGNAGRITTAYKADYKIREVAEIYKTMYGHDSVYIVMSFTQKMCEMSPVELANYVIKNGKKVA